MNKTIYLDNAATTPMCEEAVQAFTESLAPSFYNPSALYKPADGVVAKIQNDRGFLLSMLHASSGGELYFTSGGTESNNTVLFGSKKKKGCRIIVGAGEHDSVIMPANELKNQGYDVQFAPIDRFGRVDIEKFAELLTPDTALVSVMHASNETGAINDIAEISRMTHRVQPSAIVHSDGVQAFMKLKVNLPLLDVDAYSVAAHKLYGPKGIGALILKNGVKIKPLLLGGGQEKKFRSGTESYPLIHSFAAAVDHCAANFDKNISKISKYREYLLQKLNENIDDIVVLTPMDRSVPNILTVAFKDIRGEVLLHALEDYGILVGIGSACSSHHESRFKKLLKLDGAHSEGIVRFSMSEQNEIDEVDYVADCIAKVYRKLSEFKRI